MTATTGAAPAVVRRRTPRRARPEQLLGMPVGWLFAGPAVVLLLLFLVLPFALALGLSFTNQRLVSPLPLRFLGLENYRRVFADDAFRRALVNNAVFSLVVVPVQTAFALWLAILVNRRLRGTAFFRTAYFAPVVTIMAVAATV